MLGPCAHLYAAPYSKVFMLRRLYMTTAEGERVSVAERLS